MSVKEHIVVFGRLLPILLFLLTFSVKAQDYYWRGGSGNWSDPANWESSFGGIPTALDNVYFDDNSFSSDGQTVTIDKFAECNNMNWTGVTHQPNLVGQESISVYGSFQLSQQMVVDYNGNIYFKAADNEQNINFSGHQLNSNLIFEGAGQWNFISNIDVGEANISLIEGKIDTKGKSLVCGSFFSIGDLEREIKLNGSLIKIVGFNGQWNVNNSLNLQKGNSKIEISNSNPLSESTFRGGGLNYQRVELYSNVVVLGNNAFEYLKLNAGINCSLQSGKTQTIRQNLSARGCAGLINIRATKDDYATIEKVSGDIQISFVGLQYIKANMNNGGQFVASYSVDSGNNQDCIITSESRDMRWVNGSGRWSDTLHWNALIASSDSKCVPLPYDNVLFDENSFSGTDTVKVDLVSSYCNNLFWDATENAVLTNLFDSSRIKIYGSLQFAQQMQNNFQGTFFFKSTSGIKTIKTNGVAFAGDVGFSGESGRWDLQDGINVKGTINFQKGTLNSHNYPVFCDRFISDSSSSRTLKFGTSLFKIRNSSPDPGLRLNNQNLVFNNNKLKIELEGDEPSIEIFGGDTIRFHQLSFTNANGQASLRNDSTYSIFQRVSFAGSGEILGNNMFDTIMLSKACVYSLHSGRTQTINNEIIAPGSCEGTLILKSTKNGVRAKLKMLGDSLIIKHISLRDIQTVPNAVYIAKRAVDLGNNLGWSEISGIEQRELFWVGGSGDWNETQHWSLTSNGSGGECVPTPKDVVRFDKYSVTNKGEKVTVDLNNAFAYDLIWSDELENPLFVADEYTALRIFGSMELSQNMNFLFEGPIYFESSEPGQTIRTNGLKFYYLNNSFFFDGVGGEWTMMDDLDLGHSDTLGNSINLINGSLITNNKTINCYRFISNSSNTRSLSLGNSDINLFKHWILNGRNLNFEAETSHLNIESGHLLQRFAENIQYNNVFFNSDTRLQKLVVTESDTVRFRNISINNGELSGDNSHVFAEDIQFSGKGSVNNLDSTGMNVYTIGSLHFDSFGAVYGNDTIEDIHFNSTGLIMGSGEYNQTFFAGDGDIFGSNQFGTLSFSPGYIYQLEGEQTQTITNQFNIRGNNCESIWLQSTNDNQAEIFKDSDTVQGDFIEMENISATGGATFDAGYFSTDLNTSNTDWIFHDNPMKYQLDSITTDIKDTLIICASNFNAGIGTTYLWQKYPDGDTVGTGFCLKLPPYNTGYYTLSVFYNEGEGCVKYDTLLWGCFYSMELDNTDVSCYGSTDGAITIKILDGTGSGPYDILWYDDGDTIANTTYVDNLAKGTYSYSVTDKEGCAVYGTSVVEEPDSLALAFNVDYNQNTIEVDVEGGVNPFTYLWENGSINYYTDIEGPGEYIVEVTDENNCLKTGSVFVDNRFVVLAPTAFTPNGDGLNDNFELYWQGPEIMNYQLDIFGRWGSQVFSSTNFQEYWNGKLFNSGDLQPMGVYSWRLIVTSYEGKQTVSQGTVTLIN